MGQLTKEWLNLSAHLNFEIQEPRPGESEIAFALRCAAFLVSPPQVEGEDTTIECTEVAKQIVELEAAVRTAWDRYRLRASAALLIAG